MDKSIENKLQEVDSQIIGLYTKIGLNGNKSLKDIKLAIRLLEQDFSAGDQKVYKFHCCDRD
jgi:hypothetical protein